MNQLFGLFVDVPDLAFTNQLRRSGTGVGGIALPLPKRSTSTSLTS